MPSPYGLWPERLLTAISLLLMAALTAYGQAAESLTVYAASSLTNAFERLAADFGEQRPNAEITINFASSSSLAAQLIAGAPADVFASAAETPMSLVIDSRRIEAETVKTFARNQLALILPADNPAQIHAPQDLANENVLLVLAADGTPIRTYANAMLAALDDEYDPDLSQRILDNLVSEESNVRQVTARVALGEADAAIVYQTDSAGEIGKALITIPIDPRFNQTAAYPIATLSDSPNPALAEMFIEFVLSDKGQTILRAYGFCSPDIIDIDIATEAAPAPTSEAHDESQTKTAPCG